MLSSTNQDKGRQPVVYQKLIANIVYLFSKKAYHKKNGIKIDLIECYFIKVLKEIVFKLSISFKSVISLLEKKKEEKTRLDIKIIAEFLSEKYEFFKKIKESKENSVLYQLISVLNLESFKKDDFIIKFNDVGSKFYILLDGTIGVYKPKLVPAQLYVRDFVNYLLELKHKDSLALERVERKNAYLYDIDRIKFNKYDYKKLPDHFIKRNLFIEENILLVELGAGASFGEMALLQNTKRNASIISHSDTILASIDKVDYDLIIRDIERKKLNIKLDDLQQNFLIFKTWDKYLISKFMNYFSLIKMNKGDILYHQNDKSDAVYLVMNGSLEVNTKINIGNFSKIKKYLLSKTEIVFDWLRDNAKKEVNLKMLKEKLESFRKIVGEYPFIKDKKEYKRLPETKNKFLEAKWREMEIKDPKKIITVKIRNVNFKDCLGIEEAFECKRRYSTVECVSPSAEVNKIDLVDLIDFFRRKDIPFKEIENLIKERKDMLISQLSNNLNVENRNLDRKVELQYNTLLTNNFNIKTLFSRTERKKKGTISYINKYIVNIPVKGMTHSRNFSDNMFSINNETNKYPYRSLNSIATNKYVNTYNSTPNIFYKTTTIMTSNNFTNTTMSEHHRLKLQDVIKLKKKGEKYREEKLKKYLSQLKTKGKDYLEKEVISITGIMNPKHVKSSSLSHIKMTEDLEDKIIKAHSTSRNNSSEKEFRKKLYLSNNSKKKTQINIPLEIKMKYFKKQHIFNPNKS